MSDWLAEIESRVSMALRMRDRDEALDEQHEICRDDVPRLIEAIRRWEAFDFERDTPARLVESVLAVMVERDQWRARAEVAEGVVAALEERRRQRGAGGSEAVNGT